MILESLRAGVAFLPRALSRPWFLLLLLVTALAAGAATALADPRSWLSTAIVFATVFYLPLIQAPLYRLAIPEAPAEPDVSGGALRYVRVVAVALLTDLFLAVPGLLLIVVGLGAAYGMAYAYPGFNPLDASTWTASGPVLVAGLTVLAIGGLGILWLSARVGLGAAATVAQRRVLMLSSWPLTRGFGWRLAIARLAVSGGVLVLVWALSLAVRSIAPVGWATRSLPVFGALVLLALRLPMKIGVLGYFYDHRSPLPPTP